MVAERAPRRPPSSAVPFSPPPTRIVDIPGKGRGVVAARRLKAGELVELAPVIVVPAKDYDAVSSTVLDGYVYDWGRDGELAVALGQGSLYNHSFQPNVVYEKRLSDRLIEYRALRDVEPGEELCINYNGVVDDDTPLWFEVKE